MTLWRNMRRTTLTMIFFTVLFTALMALVFDLTRVIVIENEKKAKLALLTQVLPVGSYDNDLLRTTIILNRAQARRLGNDEASFIYLAKKNGRTYYIIIEATAPDGYGGKIKLLLGINRAGHIQAVRVVTHKETPGLGDYIELAKSDWILGFNGASLHNGPRERWQVKKDGGTFDYMSGATISARAIVNVVHLTLEFVMAEHQRFFE